MISTLPSRSSVSRSSVQRDLPPEARVCRLVDLSMSPRLVWLGRVVVGREGGRRFVKRETWARARAEERVPMRRVLWVEGWGVAGVVMAGGGGGAAIVCGRWGIFR